MSGFTADSDFGFSEILNVPGIKERTTLRSRGKKTRCFPRSQTVSVSLYIQTKTKNNTAVHTNLKELGLVTSESNFQVELERFD